MTVPYTFANATGSLALSELDANFAAVGEFSTTANTVISNSQPNITTVGILHSVSVTGNVIGGEFIGNGAGLFGVLGADIAGQVANALIAGTVTTNAQPNITSVGILSSLSSTGNIVSGNITTAGNVTGNYYIGNGSQLTSVTATSVGTLSSLSATGNITGGNLLTGGLVSSTGNVTAGNVRTAGVVSATANVTGGNIITTGTSSRYMDVDVPAIANITATGTYTLSSTNSINLLIANNTGYTATLNMPATPQDGQICNFAVSGNTVTLAAGTGIVLPTYAGSTTAGTGYRYVYRLSNTSWYRIG